MMDPLMGSNVSGYGSTGQSAAQSQSATTPQGVERQAAREKAALAAAERSWSKFAGAEGDSVTDAKSEAQVTLQDSADSAANSAQLQAAVVQLSNAAAPVKGVALPQGGAAPTNGTAAQVKTAAVEPGTQVKGAPVQTGISEAGKSEFAKLMAAGREMPTLDANPAGVTKQVRAGEEPPRSASLKPATLQSASSMKAASMIAGLQPWSKDWVFSGKEEATPDLKTVFANSNPATDPSADTGLREMIRGALAAQAAGNGAAPVATMNPALVAGASGAKFGRSESTSVEGVSPFASDASALTEGLTSDSAVGSVDGMALRELAPGSDLLLKTRGAQSLSAAPVAAGMGGAVSGLSGSEFVAALAAARGGARESNGGEADEGQAQSRGLRVVEGGKSAGTLGGANGLSQKGRAGAKHIGGAGDEFLSISPMSGTAVQSSVSGIKPAPAQLTGHVTQGAMSRERLDSHALTGLSSEIRNLGANGGGEIRIRLKPENLGELHLRVVTRGNEVGLRIQASDDHAKKIIEESMGYLRESLSSNQLSLARVEVTVAQAASAAFGAENGGFSQSQDQSQQYLNSQQFDSQFQSSFGSGQQSGANFSGGQDRWSGTETDGRLGTSAGSRRSSAVPAQVAGSVGGAARWTTGGAGANSRLNVMA